jgi:GxxExxY protein
LADFLFKDLTYSIRSCIFSVHNDIGVGYDEETYHQALIRKFELAGIPFVSKEHTKLRHRETLIREFVLDFLIEDKVILSLKCLPSNFLQVNFVQLFAELKLWRKNLGFLINFGQPKVKIERIIFHEKPVVIDENFDYIKERMSHQERSVLKELRETIVYVANEQGLGFGKVLLQKIMETELTFRRIKFQKDVSIPINYLGETIRIYKMRNLLIENSIILGITALQDSISYHDISKIKSYLKALNLSIGIAVNFGKSKIEIKGVHHS